MPSVPNTLPVLPGVGYKPQHLAALLADPGAVAWLEIHAENYMSPGGPHIAQLKHLRQRFPISCHGVGLSIGGEADLDRTHLQRLKTLVDWLEPAMFSEHLAWSTHETSFYNDLLPVPYNAASLARVCEHVDQVQQTLGRQMLLENPSTYVAFSASTYSETDFIAEIARRTGCGLLLDVNNVFVSATNQQFDPRDYLDAFPTRLVQEIHLGGHAQDADEYGAPLLIDSHSAAVVDPVWALYDYALRRCGPKPTLIEWDNDVPDWPVLEAEAALAGKHLAAQTVEA